MYVPSSTLDVDDESPVSTLPTAPVTSPRPLVIPPMIPLLPPFPLLSPFLELSAVEESWDELSDIGQAKCRCDEEKEKPHLSSPPSISVAVRVAGGVIKVRVEPSVNMDQSAACVVSIGGVQASASPLRSGRNDSQTRSGRFSILRSGSNTSCRPAEIHCLR